MRPKTPEGRRRALQNLKQFRRSHVRSGAFSEPANSDVAVLRTELEVGLRHDRGLQEGTPLPMMDQVRLVVLAGKLAKLQAVDARGSVDRWLRLAPNHARVSSRIPAYVTAYLQLQESALSLAGELGLPIREAARLAGGRTGVRDLSGLLALAAEPELEIVVRYEDRGAPSKPIAEALAALPTDDTREEPAP